MASFKVYTSASLAQLSEMSEAERWQILEPAAELAREAYSEAVEAAFIQHSGDLAASPAVEKKKDKGGAVARIGLKGKHSKSSTGVRMKKDRNGKRRRSGRYSGTNAEVGYFLNYGTPRIAATHWFDNTSDKIEPEVQAKIEEGWNAYLDSKGV